MERLGGLMCRKSRIAWSRTGHFMIDITITHFFQLDELFNIAMIYIFFFILQHSYIIHSVVRHGLKPTSEAGDADKCRSNAVIVITVSFRGYKIDLLDICIENTY